MSDLAKFRPSDTCPHCGSGEVFEGTTIQAHAGPVHIDGCASCQKVWERETRANPGLEPCSNCAFLPGSPEMESGKMWEIIRATLEGPGIFYCHRRVPFSIADGRNGGFEHQIDGSGRRCTNASPCAGWIKAKLREKRSQVEEQRP